MKKIFKLSVLLLLILITALSFSSCNLLLNAIIDINDKTVLDLPEFEQKECYSTDGIDITIFNKYYYNINTENLDKSNYLEKIQEDDLLEINNFIDDYEKYIDMLDRCEIHEKYDFDKVKIQAGDYFYIENENRYNMQKRFHSYDIYYFDVETQIMYFMHNDT